MPACLTPCACFGCRLSFKRFLADWELGPKCPNCGEPTLAMGRNFRAPPVRAARQWRKVAMLRAAGVHFVGTQSDNLGHFPDTLLEAREFIRRNRAFLVARQIRLHARSQALAKEEQRRTEKVRLQRARHLAMRRKVLAQTSSSLS